VDDATSRLLQLRFVTSESAFDYFRATRAYLEARCRQRWRGSAPLGRKAPWPHNHR